MILLAGAELVLPDRILTDATLTIDGDRIAEIRPNEGHGAPSCAFQGHYIVPGFIDIHVHGVDSLDEGEPIAAMARALPRYGVTAFCPTTVACAPEALRRVLDQVRLARSRPVRGTARVLPAHLESNFINPAFAGAQPLSCLRSPAAALGEWAGGSRADAAAAFSPGDILREIERAAPDVGIVTLAPELQGGVELIAWLAARHHRVSLGHSSADYDQAVAAIAAGASGATHLFNRMPALNHRAPGLVGAVLSREDICAELICDGIHVHPAMLQAAIAAKHPSRVVAISDGTSVAGTLARTNGATGRLGNRVIAARDGAAYLDDGTLAGSALTMDGAFRALVSRAGVSLVDAATMCATTPARELRLVGHGLLALDAVADLTILDSQLSVVQTYVGGQLAYSRS